MSEKNKQEKDQKDKSIEHQQHAIGKKQRDTKNRPAGSSTDAASVNDKQYVERVEEKTEKH